MDETDALVRPNDGGGININDDDDAPTVEETYEITTTRRKTIRTSYKIQEVSCLMMCIHRNWSSFRRCRSVGVSCRMIHLGELKKRMSLARSETKVQTQPDKK